VTRAWDREHTELRRLQEEKEEKERQEALEGAGRGVVDDARTHTKHTRHTHTHHTPRHTHKDAAPAEKGDATPRAPAPLKTEVRDAPH
jgi:hypothetical protein